MPPPSRETLEEFAQSLAYGSRTDLHFKFLAKLSDADNAEFLRQLLDALGDAFDTGEFETVRALVGRWQVHAYQQSAPKFVYDDGPFTQLRGSLSEATVALITAGGVYVEGHDPIEGQTQDEAVARIDEYLRQAPVLTEIPADTPRSHLRVRHPGYDIRGADRDIGAVFPAAALDDLAAEGRVGAVSDSHYSFVGAASQLSLRRNVAPAWAEQLRGEDVDAFLLVAT